MSKKNRRKNKNKNKNNPSIQDKIDDGLTLFELITVFPNIILDDNLVCKIMKAHEEGQIKFTMDSNKIPIIKKLGYRMMKSKTQGEKYEKYMRDKKVECLICADSFDLIETQDRIFLCEECFYFQTHSYEIETFDRLKNTMPHDMIYNMILANRQIYNKEDESV